MYSRGMPPLVAKARWQDPLEDSHAICAPISEYLRSIQIGTYDNIEDGNYCLFRDYVEASLDARDLSPLMATPYLRTPEPPALILGTDCSYILPVEASCTPGRDSRKADTLQYSQPKNALHYFSYEIPFDKDAGSPYPSQYMIPLQRDSRRETVTATPKVPPIFSTYDSRDHMIRHESSTVTPSDSKATANGVQYTLASALPLYEFASSLPPYDLSSSPPLYDLASSRSPLHSSADDGHYIIPLQKKCIDMDDVRIPLELDQEQQYIELFSSVHTTDNFESKLFLSSEGNKFAAPTMQLTADGRGIRMASVKRRNPLASLVRGQGTGMDADTLSESML